MTAQAINTQQNLILHSEEFDHATWTNASLTITANTDANPLTGAVTADKVAPTAANAVHSLGQANPGGTELIVGDIICLSLYAKWRGISEKYLVMGLNGGNDTIWFDLNLGAAASGGGSLLGSAINAVPGQAGWYHCEAWAYCTTTTGLQFLAVAAQDGVISFVGSTDQCQVWWGAQLTKANQAVNYVQTVGAIVNTGPLRNLIGRTPA